MTLLEEQNHGVKSLREHKLFNKREKTTHKQTSSSSSASMLLLPPLKTLQTIDSRLVIPSAEQNYDRPIGIPARRVKVCIGEADGADDDHHDELCL
jgi:hypothetical protein